MCKMLGYGRAINATTGAHFGQGSGVIMLDEVLCLGKEENLAACSHNGFKKHNCDHSEDAGVICSRIGIKNIINFV